MIVLEQDPALIKYVCDQLQIDNIGKCVIFSIVFYDEAIKANRLYGAAILNNYRTYDIELSIFMVDTKKSVKGLLKAVFKYCFGQLGVDRVTVTINADNKRSYRQSLRLGFKLEGKVRRARRGKDVYILGMLKEECRFI